QLVDTLPLSLSPRQRDDIRLGVSELVTNSVVHGRGRTRDPVDILISVTAARIRCEVSDQGSGFRPTHGPSAVGGLGLVILDGLAARWGTNRGGRSVWFELDRAG
ncbi:MAG: hypothetical protein QOF29_3695, partial [bacterium]